MITTKTDRMPYEIDTKEFQKMVEQCAYYKSEARGFTDGFEMEDWLKAEQEIKDQIRVL